MGQGCVEETNSGKKRHQNKEKGKNKPIGFVAEEKEEGGNNNHRYRSPSIDGVQFAHLSFRVFARQFGNDRANKRLV